MNKKTYIDFKDLYGMDYFEENIDAFSPIWHYTSVGGLTGIIKNEKKEYGKLHFWFTRSDCLNDPSEGEHILKLFKKVCSDLLKEGTIKPSFYESIKCETISKNQTVIFPIPNEEENISASFITTVPCDAYICSFSFEEDSLDMWRYYSKGNGGYGLEFSQELFDELKQYAFSFFSNNATFSMIRSFKVIYEDETKENILRNIIKNTFDAYENSKLTKEQKDIQSKQFVEYALKIFQFQFKDKCYKSEKEFRFVFYRPLKKPENLKNELPDIKYREQNGIPVPYIEIPVPNDKNCLQSILISPFVDVKNSENVVSYYLSQCGFTCKVTKSTLPVRK